MEQGGTLDLHEEGGKSLLLLLFFYNYALKIVVYLWLNCHRSCVQIDPKSSNDEKKLYKIYVPRVAIFTA